MARSRRDYFIVAGAAIEAAHLIRRDFINRITSRVTQVSLRRGMRSGRRGWLYIAFAAQGLRILQRVGARKPEVFQIKLLPGQSVEIREIPRAK
jgi:hypothetical protein